MLKYEIFHKEFSIPNAPFIFSSMLYLNIQFGQEYIFTSLKLQVRLDTAIHKKLTLVTLSSATFLFLKSYPLVHVAQIHNKHVLKVQQVNEWLKNRRNICCVMTGQNSDQKIVAFGYLRCLFREAKSNEDTTKDKKTEKIRERKNKKNKYTMLRSPVVTQSFDICHFTCSPHSQDL